MLPFHLDGPSGRDHQTEERCALIERVRDRFHRARARSGQSADAQPLCFHLHEAILVAHDLHMLGCIPEPPTLRWRPVDAEAALARWEARVVPDPAGLSLEPT